MRSVSALTLAASLAALAVIVAPATRWLVRFQLSALPGGGAQQSRAIRSAPPEESPLTRLRPAANALICNPREAWRLTRTVQPAWAKAIPANDPAQLRAFVARARDCVRAEPGNAYFHLALAFGLLELGQRDAGVAEIHRAALAPKFVSHATDDFQSRVATLEGALGRQPIALVQSPLLASVSSSVGATTFGATVRAALEARRREAAGDLAGGLAIRRDMVTLGRRFMESSDLWAADQEGYLFVYLAIVRPETIPNPDQTTLPDVARRWHDWATAHGAADIADVGRLAFATRRSGLEPMPSLFLPRYGDRATVAVALSSALLFTALALSAAGQSVARRHWVRSVLLAALVAGGGAVLYQSLQPLLEILGHVRPRTVVWIGAAIPVVALALVAVWSARRPAAFRERFPKAARTAAAVALLAYAVSVVAVAVVDSALRRDLDTFLANPHAYNGTQR